MRALVTGGSGFIGQHVVRQLIRMGHDPIVLDRSRSSTADSVLLGDIRDYSAVLEAVGQVDSVFHLAGVLGTAETINEPRPSAEINILGSLNVFQACRHHSVPCSYISVGNYWMNNSYSISKTCAERFAWMFNKEHDTKISVVRALNAYGPNQKDKPVRKIVPNLILPALRGEEILIYGDGEQVMDMIWVEDVADILIRTITVDHGVFTFDPSRERSDGPRFEAGTGRATTVNEIAQLVVSKIGRGTIRHAPMRSGEPERSVVLGEPETLRPLYDGQIPNFLPLEIGIERTIAFYASAMEQDAAS